MKVYAPAVSIITFYVITAVTANRIISGEIRKTSNNGDNYMSAMCQVSAVRVDVNVTNICHSF